MFNIANYFCTIATSVSLFHHFYGTICTQLIPNQLCLFHYHQPTTFAFRFSLSSLYSSSISPFICITLLHNVRKSIKLFRRSISLQSQAQMLTVPLYEYFNECGSSDVRARVLLFPQCFLFLILLPLRLVSRLFLHFSRKKGANAHRNKER